jgi:predicted nucleic acid-binding protein
MKVLIDTNVVLDFALSRHPFYEEAKTIFHIIGSEKIHGYISASAVTDIFYLTRKSLGWQMAIDFILTLIEVIDVLSVDKNTITKALLSGWTDFEDAVQAQAAIENDLDVIITRNVKDFQRMKKVKVFTPQNFIQQLAS